MLCIGLPGNGSRCPGCGNEAGQKTIRGMVFCENDRQSMLVIIGADEWGNKDVLGLIAGFRESTQSWRELLNLNRRSAKRNAGGWRLRRS